MCFGARPGDETGAVGDGDESADVVEEIDEEEDEDDFEGTDVERAGDVEVECGGFDRRQIVGCGLPVDLMADDAEERGGQDADEHRCADAEDLQGRDEEKAEDCKHG